jgi:hypothetical protein
MQPDSGRVAYHAVATESETSASWVWRDRPGVDEAHANGGARTATGRPADTLGSSATVRRIVATIAVVCGVGLIVLPFALSLFDRAPAGQRVTDRFRQTMSARGLHDLATNFATMNGLVDQFIHETSPQLARKLRMTPRQYDAYVRQNFPAVAAGVAGIPPLVAFVTPVAAQLEALHPQFAAIDSLPFFGLPLTTIPWILLALGIVLIGLGGVILRTSGPPSLVAAAVLGLAMLVVPLALSYPRKASDAAKVVAVGRGALSRKAADGAQTANKLIDGMVTEVDTKMVPALAHRLNVSSAALEASIASNYPAVAKGLAAWSSIKPGAVELVRRQVASVPDGSKMNGLNFKALPWYIMAPGIALLVAAACALASDRWRTAP